MARPRQPIALIEAKGKTHMGKAEIEERKAKEIKAKSDNIKPPSYLPKELKKEFKSISNQLIELNIMSNLDIDTLARYLISKKFYLDITQQMLDNPELLQQKDVSCNQDRFFKQCRCCAMDLGLSISSRCKLVIPKKEETKPKTMVDELFGGVLNDE